MKTIITVLILLIPCMATAIDISGYYENTLMPEFSDRTSARLLDVSKLRLDFQAGGADNELEFKGNINFIAYHSNVSIDITPYLPQAVVDTLNSRDIPLEISFDANRIFLDNAYLTLRRNGFRIRAGRQQLTWGPAYSFNPTDLFHRKDMLDPSYEKEGVTALRGDYQSGIVNQVALIMVPSGSFDRSGYAIRIATYIEKIGYDVGITLHRVTDSTSLDTSEYEPVKQRRRAIGLDFSGGLFGLGFWVEGNYNAMEIEDDFIRAVTGFDYTLTNGLYMIIEGLYDQRAEEEAPYSARDWMESIMFGEPLSRIRLLAGVRKDITGLVTGSLYWFGGTDGSMVLNPRIDASVAQNADLALFGMATFGKKEGQFHPGNYALTARISLFF